MNYLHDIAPGTFEEMNVIIEVPKGSKNKYEIDKESGLIALDRVYKTSQDMPYDYGFVPQTLWEDGDALDVIVLTTHALHPGILTKVRPVAMMDMVDNGESDVKVIAVPVGDVRWDSIQDLEDIGQHSLDEMEHYFTTYKGLDGKTVEIKGFHGKDKAIEAFKKSREMYDQDK